MKGYLPHTTEPDHWPMRGPSRVLVRIGAIVLVLVLTLLMAYAESWLLEDAPAAGLEYAVATPPDAMPGP